jgi:glucose-1-phosphate adenylyltransferase
MNLYDVIETHVMSRADITISTRPMPRSEAASLGIMKVDKSGEIIRFAEKPGDTPMLDDFRTTFHDEERYLASMGIYVFNMDVLKKVLRENDQSDFGKHIIPGVIGNYKVMSYVFDGYWEDIGTIRSFWAANLALTDPLPSFSFYEMSAPIYTRMRYLPPSKINQCSLSRCLLSDGCIISGKSIEHSVVGLRALVGEGSVIKDSIIMGADYYEHGRVEDPSGIPMGIGKNCHVERAIIDKNVRIGDNVAISPEGKPDDIESELYWIRDGIMVIPKNTVIPSGTVL